MKNLAVALAGVALLAAPAYGQPAQTNSPAPSTDSAAKPPAGADEQAEGPAAPAAPKPASSEENSGQPAPDKPAADSGDNPSR